jgi:hypothetical protein
VNSILKGLLDNNLVEIEYLSVGKFPTRGLFTRHLHFMYHEDSMGFNEGDFFQAYDILRMKKVTILNEEDILSIGVYNPDSLDPKTLYLGVCQPTHGCRSTQIKKFLSACGCLCSRGDTSSLNIEEKLVLIEFYAGLVGDDLSDDLVDELIVDLGYMSGTHRSADVLQYGLFFGMDIDFNSEKDSVAHAAKKWLSLISVYCSLYSQELEHESPILQAINEMRLPDPADFQDFEQVLGFWPYVLTPRPVELPKF